MNRAELNTYLILLGIKHAGNRLFSYHKTDKKYLYVAEDKLVILGTYNGLAGHKTITTEYPYPVTIEQLKEILV